MPSHKGRELNAMIIPSFEGVLLAIGGRMLCLTPDMARRMAADLNMAAEALSKPDSPFFKPWSDYDVH